MANKSTLTRNEGRGGNAAEVSIEIGERAAFRASVTSAGLLSVGVLVSSILLSTAMVVFAARRGGREHAKPKLPAQDNLPAK